MRQPVQGVGRSPTCPGRLQKVVLPVPGRPCTSTAWWLKVACVAVRLVLVQYAVDGVQAGSRTHPLEDRACRLRDLFVREQPQALGERRLGVGNVL
eukprot:4018056-Pyramimonas_sp.AAC.1